MLLLKIQSLSYGHSGVQLETVQRLIDLFNHDMLPVIFQLGSLGASGDLSPLAHMSLPLLGLGEIYYKGEKRNTADVAVADPPTPEERIPRKRIFRTKRTTTKLNNSRAIMSQ